MEEWRAISEFPGYFVSSLGRIKSADRTVPNPLTGGSSIHPGRVLRTHRDKHGYVVARLSANKKMYNRFVHRLVAKAFLPAPEQPEVNHLNLDRSCNVVENLAWTNRQENTLYSVDKGSYTARTNPNVGGRVNLKRRNKLTPEDVEVIKTARASGATYVASGALVGVSASTAWHIVHGNLWS